VRITLRLPDAAREVLLDLASRERREARDEAALLVIEGLARRGLVSVDGTTRAVLVGWRQDADLN
jgi:hypothetical protein